MGLATAVAGAAAAGKEQRANKSSFVPEQFVDTARTVIGLYKAALPALTAGDDAESRTLKDFMARFALEFTPGKILEPIAEQYGASLRVQRGAAKLDRAWRNCHITGRGRSHLGPARPSNARLRDILLDLQETYRVMARWLQHIME
jgi:hypothetical protein